MPLHLHRRHLLRAGLGLAVTSTWVAARACDFQTTNLRIDNVWARATGAASDARIYMVFDDVDADDRLIGAEMPFASGAELGGVHAVARVDLRIPSRRRTMLCDTGTYLRLTGLRQPLQGACSYPLRLVFERSGAIAVDIDVEAS